MTRIQYDINKFLKTAEEREDVPSTKNGVAESSENVQLNKGKTVCLSCVVHMDQVELTDPVNLRT